MAKAKPVATATEDRGNLMKTQIRKTMMATIRLSKKEIIEMVIESIIGVSPDESRFDEGIIALILTNTPYNLQCNHCS